MVKQRASVSVPASLQESKIKRLGQAGDASQSPTPRTPGPSSSKQAEKSDGPIGRYPLPLEASEASRLFLHKYLVEHKIVLSANHFPTKLFQMKNKKVQALLPKN